MFTFLVLKAIDVLFSSASFPSGVSSSAWFSLSSLVSWVLACEPRLLSGIVSSSVISLVSVPQPQVLHCEVVRARKVLQITHFPLPNALS